MARKTLEAGLTLSNAKFVALITVLLGLVLAWLAGQIPGHWYTEPIDAFGSTLLAVGAISIIYELFLRRQIQDELLSLVDLKKNLAESQIKGASESAGIDWERVINGASEVRCLLLELAVWLQINWPRVLQCLQERKAVFQILTPNPEAEYIPELAARLNIDEQNYRAQLRDAAAGLDDRWTAAKEARQLHEGSSIELRYLAKAPSYSVVIGGTRSVVAIGRSLGRAAREDDLAVQFDGPGTAYPSSWLIQQITSVKDGNIRFGDTA
jgi:hypothetical protein